MSRDDQDMTDPDQFEGAPHPREQLAFFGHEEGEGAFLEGLRSGRLPTCRLAADQRLLCYRSAKGKPPPADTVDTPLQ